MPPPSPTDLDAGFRALADPTRRAILLRLAQGPAPVGALAGLATAPMSGPAISRHLRVLEAAGLMGRERQGRHLVCHLQPEGLAALEGWMAEARRFWSARLDGLALHLATEGEP